MQPWIELSPGLRVTGDGVAWLPRAGAVVVADIHAGYEFAARRRGGYLPLVADGAVLGQRLVALARRVGADRMIVAGDLRHSTHDADDAERFHLGQLAGVVREHLELDVVLGNHDRDDSLVDGSNARSLQIDGVLIVHEPPRFTPSRWTICGHLHPRITLRDAAGVSTRFPCALVGERLLVLPAFSEWAGGAEARGLVDGLQAGSWRALPISDGSIADLGIVFHSDGDR